MLSFSSSRVSLRPSQSAARNGVSRVVATAPFLQGDKADCKVSAVDGRDIARLESIQQLGVVPVEEVALVALEPAQNV